MSENMNEAVRALILKLVNDAMEKQDRYITITFLDEGPCMTIWPLGGDDA